MSHSTPMTRRTLLAGTASGIAISAMPLGIAGEAIARVAPNVPMPANQNQALCIAHHQELSSHLSRVLNAAYVDERMKNTMLTTSKCPHCQVAIAPGEITTAAFAALG